MDSLKSATTYRIWYYKSLVATICNRIKCYVTYVKYVQLFQLSSFCTIQILDVFKILKSKMQKTLLLETRHNDLVKKVSQLTCKPSSTNLSVKAAPIPELAPVTIAVFPIHLSIERTILAPFDWHRYNEHSLKDTNKSKQINLCLHSDQTEENICVDFVYLN